MFLIEALSSINTLKAKQIILSARIYPHTCTDHNVCKGNTLSKLLPGLFGITTFIFSLRLGILGSCVIKPSKTQGKYIIMWHETQIA